VGLRQGNSDISDKAFLEFNLGNKEELALLGAIIVHRPSFMHDYSR
jgi:hypothetical protein